MIKILCDICESEDGAAPCLSARGSILCTKCHVEYHDLVRDDFNALSVEATEVAQRAMVTMKERITTKPSNVWPIH